MHGFNEKLVAQIAAFFIGKQGGDIPVLKLTKLIYLADRESMAQTGYPITNDHFVSMPHGPVNSLTLNFVDGNFSSREWSELISDRANYSVGLSREITDGDLDELSAADLDAMEKVWRDFGHMDKWEIRDWTHDNCPEWEDPNGSCNPIPHERVLKYLGVEGADELADEIRSERRVEDIFAQLRA
ncbi:MAG: Panacea domain-containing protein [Rhizobiaceae bacterium]